MSATDHLGIASERPAAPGKGESFNGWLVLSWVGMTASMLSYWAWPLLYHAVYRTGAVEAACIGPLVAALLLGLVFTRPRTRVGRFSARFISLVLLLCLLKEFAAFSTERLTIPQRHLAELLGFAALSFAFWRVNAMQFRAISKLLAIVSLLLTLGFPLGAHLNTRAGASTVLSLDAVKPAVRHNVVTILLDEWSPAYIGPIETALRSTGFDIQSEQVESAGRNTVNAIPSMLTGVRHDDVFECGYAQLCGPTGFDMSRLAVTRADIDVVGFWHPYCAIQGLRSCHVERLAANSHGTAAQNLLCAVIPWTGNLGVCTTMTDGWLAGARSGVMAAAMQAPFWKQGGVLYIHVPAPHPTADGDPHRLSDEYRANIELATTFVRAIASRVNDVFGEDATLVLTSDHALRVDMWCASPVYAPFCAKDELPPNKGYVPFMLAARTRTHINLPSRNVGVLE